MSVENNSELPKSNNTLLHAVISNKIYIAQNANTSEGKGYHCFQTHKTLKYYPLCDDFGPMNMACVLRFIETLNTEIEAHPNCKIVYCVPKGRRELTNGVFLLGSYMILFLKYTSLEVSKAFGWLDTTLIEHYRDATHLKSDFDLTLLDCWRGLERGQTLGWVRMPRPPPAPPGQWGQCDVDEYEHYDDPMNGDLHIVVPGKFVAFKGPRDLGGKVYHDDRRGFRHFSPSYYAEIFRSLAVTAVVRLNEPQYDPADFLAADIAHHALEFEDCTPPPPAIVARFLAIAAAAPRGGAVAVHCRAGLGRTGTLIALHMMRFSGFDAREAMGWLRIMRPGSVIGEQQAYLCRVERLLHASRPPHAPAAQLESLPPACAPAPLPPARKACSADGDSDAAVAAAAQVTEGMERRGAARAAARAEQACGAIKRASSAGGGASRVLAAVPNR